MADIHERKGGTKAIRFYDLQGRRRTIALGKCTKRDAERAATFVERILEKRRLGQPLDGETTRWVASISRPLAEKLVQCGLIEPRQQREATLGDWINGYIQQRQTVKAATKAIWRHVRDNLTAYFGSDKRVGDITPADADRFREHLVQSGLAPATVGKRLQVARQFFRAMLRDRLITENPFADVAAPNLANPQRFRFVTREETQKIIEACPNAHWRCIVALCRYGGLRCPSEVLSLRWVGIDWERERIRVDSPKTEHHPGRAFRMVPLFPELRPYLEESFQLAEPGAIYVIPEEYRRGAYKAEIWRCVNLRTTFGKIVRRAGLTPWPKLFQNLRSSRETELAEEFPIHVVTAWIGNTPQIANKHYLQVTEEHFQRATRAPIGAPVSCGDGLHGLETATARNAKSPVFTGLCESVPDSANTPSWGTRIRT